MATARPSQIEWNVGATALKLCAQWSEKTHQLVELKVQWKGEAPHELFSQVQQACEFVEGLGVEQIFCVDWKALFPDQLFPAFPWCLWQSYQAALNPVPAVNELSAQDSKGLLCRCFGVYKQELQALILQDPSLSAQDLSAQTQAGLGCTSCACDLKSFLWETREHFELTDRPLGRRDKQGYWVRPMGMTPAQAVLTLAPLLQTWCETRGVQVEMVDLCGHQVKLRGELSEEQLKDLQRHWESELGVRFAASLFI